MKSAMIVIGRGRQDLMPLPTGEWGRYQALVQLLLVNWGEYYRSIPGMGVNVGGEAEEQVTILGGVQEAHLDHLKKKLEDLRVEFEQEVIILTLGDLVVIGE